MTVLAHRSSPWNTVPDTTCLLLRVQPETAPHLWARAARFHEWEPARQRLAGWLKQKVGQRARSVCHQLWEPAAMEQWEAALQTASIKRAHMECSGPHALGIDFIRNVIEESTRVWYAHGKARATLVKACLGIAARWRGCCSSCACTSRRKDKEYSGSFQNDSSCPRGGRLRGS